MIEVADTGIGIKESDLPELFQPFRQVDAGTTRKHEGSGLGLSICRKLLDLLGGSIMVKSQWGRGSCFTVCLPAPPEDKK
jgi:signal transduction histidine kinase